MDVFLRGFQVALLEVDPAEGVPVCGETGYMSQVLRAKAFQRGVAQLGGGFSHGGFRVLLGAFQVHILERQLIGHVVPHRRRWRQLDGLVKLLESLVPLSQIQVGVADPDVQEGIIRRDGDGLLEFTNRLHVVVPLPIQRAEVGMRPPVQRLDLNLLAKRFDGFLMLLLLPESLSQVVVGVFVVRIHLNLFAEGLDSFVQAALRQIGAAKVVPCPLVLGFEFDHALQKVGCGGKIPVLQRGESGFMQLVGFDSRGHSRRAGQSVFERHRLSFVGANRAGESQVVADTDGGHFAQLEPQPAFRGNFVAFRFVGGAVLGVVAHHRDRHGRASRKLGRELQRQPRAEVQRRAQLKRLGVRVALLLRLRGVRQADRGQRQKELRLLARPVEVVRLYDAVFELKGFARRGGVGSFNLARFTAEAV